ncbi:MAG: zf-HC2 domain-containing protein [Bryobacter sp.]|nr:zf-HC2 domain-containing protein [Bryobacter sp.]
MKLTCTDLEILLADYIDGTLDAAAKSGVEAHLSDCAACRELAADLQAAVGFMDRCAVVEPPPELITRLLFENPAAQANKQLSPARGLRNWFRHLFEPMLRPRFAMGMAMTILSLDPVKVWQSFDNRAHRAWDRAVKYYESLRVVYELQSRLQDWTDQEEEARTKDASAPAPTPGPAGSGTDASKGTSSSEKGSTRQ